MSGAALLVLILAAAALGTGTLRVWDGWLFGRDET